MDAFETGWSVLKSFYFGGMTPDNTEGGMWRRNTVIPWLNDDPNKPLKRGEFGANLGQRSQKNPDQSAYKDDEGNWLPEDELISRLSGTLEHEGIHVAQDPALRQAFGYGGDVMLESYMGLNQGGEAEKREEDRMGRFVGAHEYGATQGGGGNRSAEKRVRSALDYAAHPALEQSHLEGLAEDRFLDLASMNRISPALLASHQGVRSRQNAQAQMAGAPNVTTPRM